MRIAFPHFARMAVASLTPAWPADCCFHLTSIVRITHVCSFDANDCEIFAMDKVRRLEMVVRAADLGGFAAAAKHLDIKPSAVSPRIAELGGALRVSRFKRRPRDSPVPEKRPE